MPYIKKDSRGKYDEHIKEILLALRDADYMMSGGCAGEAAYVFYSLLQGMAHLRAGQIRFAQIATALGAVESAKQEFLVNDVSDYEVSKQQENGPIDKWCEALPTRGFEYNREDD